MAFRMDFQKDQIVAWNSSGWQSGYSMAGGLSGTAMGEQLITAAAENGLHGEYDRERFASEEPGSYEPEMAHRFFTALVSADRIIKKHRARLPDETSPVQFWTHGFDLSMEWFGTRHVSYSEDGDTRLIPAQINFGFYPGEDDASSYFYCNPWPFDAEQLVGNPLPTGASWHTEGWQGTILRYSEICDQAEADTRLLGYAKTVFDIAMPLLTEL